MDALPFTVVYSRDNWSVLRHANGCEYVVFYKDTYICTTDSRDKADLIAATFLLGPAGVRVWGDGGVEVVKR